MAKKKMLFGTYMGGHPAIDEPKQGVFLNIDDAGVQVLGGMANVTLISMPWDMVTALSAEGPDQVQTRFTATRFALMGPFALAFKKDKKVDCFVVVESVEGEFLFQVRKKSQHELRSFLAPWSGYPKGVLPATPVAAVSGGQADQGDDRIRKLKDLAELRDQGVLTDAEFAVEKARVLDS